MNKKIFTIEDLNNLPKKGNYVYRLYNKCDVVYVGRTGSLPKRIGAHIGGGKVFDAVDYRKVNSREEAKKLELKLCDKHKPLYNALPFATRGSNNQNSKLVKDDVLEIRKEYANGGVMQKDLAKKYSVSIKTISEITSGKHWKHVGGPITKQRLKLTNDQKRKIVEGYCDDGKTLTALAKEYDVSVHTIWYHINRGSQSRQRKT